MTVPGSPLSVDEQELRRLRETMMSSGQMRELAEGAVQGMLEMLAEYDDDDPSPRMQLDDDEIDLARRQPTVGGLRAALRWTLTEIAARDDEPC